MAGYLLALELVPALGLSLAPGDRREGLAAGAMHGRGGSVGSAVGLLLGLGQHFDLGFVVVLGPLLAVGLALVAFRLGFLELGFVGLGHVLVLEPGLLPLVVQFLAALLHGDF